MTTHLNAVLVARLGTTLCSLRLLVVIEITITSFHTVPRYVLMYSLNDRKDVGINVKKDTFNFDWESEKIGLLYSCKKELTK